MDKYRAAMRVDVILFQLLESNMRSHFQRSVFTANAMFLPPVEDKCILSILVQTKRALNGIEKIF